MALLSKLASTVQDDAQTPRITHWHFYLTQAEIAQLASGSDVGVVVTIPKDTPLVDTLARVVVKRMPAELADRHQIVQEFAGDPAAIAQHVHAAARARLAELIVLVGTDVAQEVLADAYATGVGTGKDRPT
jgi:hypothetical protein